MKKHQTSVLVVDDEASIRDLVFELLTQFGYLTKTASEGDRALELVRSHEFDLVMTDVLMQPMDGIELLTRIKSIRPEVTVVVFSGFATDDMVIKALRAGAADFIKKPFRGQDLLMAVQRALHRRQAAADFQIDVESVVAEEKWLILGNDLDRIPGVVNQLTLNATQCPGPIRSSELSVALYELVLNAIEHGNLEVTYQEKTEHLYQGDYQEFLAQRRAEPRLAGRKVHIHYVMDEQGFHFTIRDEGLGFDWLQYQKKGNGVSLEPHGRGLALVAFYADRLSYNEQGNEVKLTVLKRKRAQECSKS